MIFIRIRIENINSYLNKIYCIAKVQFAKSGHPWFRPYSLRAGAFRIQSLTATDSALG
jgi:hypothetical protein